MPVMDILRKLLKSFVSTNELNQRTIELVTLTGELHDQVGWGDVRHIRRVLRVCDFISFTRLTDFNCMLFLVFA